MSYLPTKNISAFSNLYAIIHHSANSNMYGIQASIALINTTPADQYSTAMVTTSLPGQIT